MSQKTAKKKSKKSSKGAAETSVLGSLRSTRPERLGADRRGRAAKPKAAPKRAAAKKRAPKRSAKPKATAAQRPAAPPPPPPTTDGRPGGVEIVTTAVQAAGELAQIGVTVGTQLLRRAARRIPRP